MYITPTPAQSTMGTAQFKQHGLDFIGRLYEWIRMGGVADENEQKSDYLYAYH